jgi:hypothetical protein
MCNTALVMFLPRMPRTEDERKESRCNAGKTMCMFMSLEQNRNIKDTNLTFQYAAKLKLQSLVLTN